MLDPFKLLSMMVFVVTIFIIIFKKHKMLIEIMENSILLPFNNSHIF